MLNRTYIPSLSDVNVKQRSTYGNGRFKFPNNYQNDNSNGFHGGYDNQQEEEEEEEEEEEVEEEDDADNHYIVSLIACEIFQQKQREKDLAREEERNFSLLEEERGRVERLNELHAIAIFEMKEEREKEIIKIKEIEREREEENLREKEEEEKRDRENREKEQISASEGINDSKKFWDDLLLKPLSSNDREMEIESRNERKRSKGREIKDREKEYRNVNTSQENRDNRVNVNSRSSYQSQTEPMDILRNIPGKIDNSILPPNFSFLLSFLFFYTFRAFYVIYF